eukprot:6168839-Amphidinium_carterae.1
MKGSNIKCGVFFNTIARGEWKAKPHSFPQPGCATFAQANNPALDSPASPLWFASGVDDNNSCLHQRRDNHVIKGSKTHLPKIRCQINPILTL